MTELPPDLDIATLSDRLLTLLDVAGVMVSVKAVDTSGTADGGLVLRYRWANAAWLGFLGRDVAEVRGQDDLAVLPAADAAAVQAAPARRSRNRAALRARARSPRRARPRRPRVRPVTGGCGRPGVP